MGPWPSCQNCSSEIRTEDTTNIRRIALDFKQSGTGTSKPIGRVAGSLPAYRTAHQLAAPPSIVLLLPRFSTNSSVRAPTLDAQRSTLAARVFLMLRDCKEQFLVVRESSWGNVNAG